MRLPAAFLPAKIICAALDRERHTVPITGTLGRPSHRDEKAQGWPAIVPPDTLLSMKRLLSLPLLLLLFSAFSLAQDCSQTPTPFTTAKAGPTLDVHTGAAFGCATLRLWWYSTGFTGYTIALQGSQDGSTWTNVGSTLVLEGSNPTTWTSSTTTNTIVIRVYLPYFRINVSSVTGSGSIFASIYGVKGTTAAPTGSSGGGTSNVAITSPIGQKLMAASVSVAVASDQPAIPVSSTIAGNGTVLSGQQSVTGTAAALATHTTKSICVKASLANTINVFVGPTGVTTGTGLELTPGAGACLSATNSNLVFVIASTTGAAVSWLASN